MKLTIKAGSIVTKDDIDSQLLEDLMDCTGQGDATDAVKHVIENHDIEVDPLLVEKYLDGIGAWEEDELQDEATNLERFVWIMACDLAEQEVFTPET